MNFENYVFLGNELIAYKSLCYLVDNANKPVLVITLDEEILAYCEQHNIKADNSVRALEYLANIDYIFSIDNPFILSNAILKRVKRLAINYHDSLLPKYAGMYATNWALINADQYHGISFHLMTENLDAGDILYQKKFLIDRENDDAYTLGIKCLNAAESGFKILLHKLQTADINYIRNQMSPANKILSSEVPLHYGFINHMDTAQEVWRYFRAIKHVGFFSAIGILKIYFENKIWYILDCVYCKVDDSNEHEVRLCYDDGQIILKEMFCITEATACLKPQSILSKDLKKVNDINAFIKLHQQHFKTRKFWENYLKKCISDLSNKENRELTEHFQQSGQQIELVLPKHQRHYSSQVLAYAILVIYSKLFIPDTCFGLSYRNSKINDLNRRTIGQYSAQVPLINFVINDLSVSEILTKCKENMSYVASDSIFSNELYFCSSKLTKENHHLLNTPQVLILDNIKDITELPASTVQLIIDSNHPDIITVIYPDSRKQEQSKCFFNFIERLHYILQLLADNNLTISQHSLCYTGIENTLSKQFICHEVPKTKCFEQIFNEQVELRKKQVAVYYENNRINYETLYQLTNHIIDSITNAIESKGKQLTVVIMVSNHYHHYLSVLALLRIKATFIPIDRKYPVKRIKDILNAVNLDMILFDKESEQSVGRHFLAFESKFNIIDFSKKNPKIFNNNFSSSKKEDIAYICFTSGTTGIPKGIEITQNGLMHRLYSQVECYELRGDDTFINYMSPGFDSSLVESLLAFFSGAKTVILSPSDLDNLLMRIIVLIAEYSVTVLNIMPSLLQQLIVLIESNMLEVEKLKTLRMVLSGGERLSGKLAAKFFTHLECELYNTYGPTENTIDATIFKCKKQEIYDTVPIGKPIKYTSAYVLDEKLQYVPFLQKGELYLSGPCLAKGYSNNPELTKQLFIPNKYSNNIYHTRLYKTGDIVSIDTNGNLIYHGRVDDQVKIGSYRVELLEIERVLERFELISRAVVRNFESDQNVVLIAFYTTKNNVSIKHSSLIDYLSLQLPNYMIPRDFIYLEELKTDHNGKIDLKKLKKIFNQRKVKSNTTIDMVADDFEKAIREIWQNALNVEIIRNDDNFFGLGGTSIIASRIIAILEINHNISMTITDIMKCENFSHFYQMIKDKNQELILSVTQEVDSTLQQFQRYPLHPTQLGIWYNTKYITSETFQLFEGYKLSAEINIEKMHSAINLLVRNNTILRTVLFIENERPQQLIKDHAEVALTIIKSDDIDESTIGQLCYCQFDLYKGPLIKFFYITDDKSLFYLVITCHHIISDGWGMQVLTKKLMQLYNNQHLTENMSFVESHYGKDICQLLSGFDEQVAYQFWGKRITNAYNPNIPQKEYALSDLTASIQTIIQQEQYVNLSELASQCEIPLSTQQIAILLIALAKFTNSKKVSFTFNFNNRNSHAAQDKIGISVVPVIISTEFERGEQFINFSKRIHQELLAIYENPFIPFEALQEHICNMQTLDEKYKMDFLSVDYQDYSSKVALEFGNSRFKEINLMKEKAKFDLKIQIEHHNAAISIKLIYRKNNFDRNVIISLMDCIRTTIDRVNEEPHFNIDKLSMISLKDYLAITHHQFTVEDKKENGFIELLPKQSNSSKSAIFFNNVVISYGQLFTDILNIKQSLKLKKNIVGVLVERMPAYLVQTLAILESNSILIPIDSGIPEARLKTYLIQSKLDTLLTDNTHYSKVLSYSLLKVKVINIEHEIPSSAAGEQGVCENKHYPLEESSGYIIFTSGTTGKPKGVLVSIKSLLRRFSQLKNIYDLNANDIFLHYRAVTFDGTFEETLLPLYVGASVVIAHKGFNEDIVNNLMTYMLEYNITVVNIMPSLLHLIFETLTPEQIRYYCNSLRLVISGGEELSISIVNRFPKFFPQHTRLVNTYGPTENTIDSSYYYCHFDEINKVPIGKALPNDLCIVLGKDHTILPPYSVGELFVGGASLAEGYLDVSSKNNSKFLPNPYADYFKDRQHHRLYATGDMVYYNSLGMLIYLSRQDGQVKVNGKRIETAEIIRILEGLKQIKKAIISFDNSSSGQLLSCYYISVDNTPLNEFELYQALSKHLPNYMVPRHYFQINEIPLTRHGKIDYQQLTTGGHRKKSSNKKLSQYDALINIYERILNTEINDVELDFLSMGGNSLSSVLINQNINDTFNVETTVADVYTYNTIHLMFSYIHSTSAKKIEATLSASNTLKLHLIPTMGGLSACYHLLRKLSANHFNHFSYDIMDESLSKTTLEQLARKVVEQIQSVQSVGPYYILGWSFGGILAYEICQQLHRMNHSIGALFLLDSFAPIAENKRSYTEVDMIDTLRLNPQNSAMLDKSIIDKLIKASKVHRQILIDYQPSSYKNNVVLIKALGNIEHRESSNNSMGWGSLVQGEITIHTQAAGHYNLLSDEVHCKQLLSILAKECYT